MKKIVLGFNRVSDESVEELKKHFNFVFFKDIDPLTNQEFLDKLAQAEGIIGMGFPANSETLDLAPKLKIVSNIGTGYNNLDIAEMTKRDIMGTNTPGILDNTTADFIFSLILATARRIPEMDHFVKNGNWKYTLEKDTFGVDVYNKKIGIIGMGNIGSLIAKRAHCGFDMDVLYYNRSRNMEAEEKYNAKYCDLEILLKESDFVCIMTPLTKETENLIGKSEFKLMKKSAIFINGSRGGTVNEKDLIDALNNNEIRGAGVDVYSQEPVNPDNPLLGMNNVVTTPHMGASTEETIFAMSQLATKNIITGLEGKEPPNLIGQ